MKSVCMKTAIVIVMIAITIHFHQAFISAKQSYKLMNTSITSKQIVEPLLF